MVVERSFLKWIAAGIVLLLLFSLPDGCTVRLKGVFKDVTFPVQHFSVKTVHNLKEGIDAVCGLGGMLKENGRLSEEVISLQAELAKREQLEQANLELQKQLGFYNSQKYRLIPCQVSARAINGWWQSLRLDRGAGKGIEPNRAVISPDGLVGKTTEVSAYTADVLLISDPSCQVSARVSRTGSFGMVTGHGVNARGYPVVRMQFIHKDAPVKAGDAVVTSGLGGVFPKDILIGCIETVGLEEAGLYQVAVIIPKAVTEMMEVVFVAAGDPHAEVQQ
ncbi:MAG: rod shape-determining protein MreC [Pontiellaceae bacterium]|jgi:rod shape-determining protein MreC|nr:rod shape-determining protein MreC [Pontiellaceae bacterium]